MPAYFNNTSTKVSKKSKVKSEKQLLLEKKHKEFLKQVGVTGKKSKSSHFVYTKLAQEISPSPTSDKMMPMTASKKDTMVYSGENKLIGIAVLHKSCLQPVFASNKQAAIDIANMRR